MPPTPEPTAVLGLPVHLCSDYASWLRSRIEQGRGAHVVTLNAEMAVQSQRDAQLRQAIQQADLVVPDGSGLVGYLRWHHQRQHRCPGIELAAELLASVEERQGEVACYGGAPGVVDGAARAWQRQLPSLSVLTAHGYLSAQAERAFCQQLQARQPQLILVGLGSPRQEQWIARNRALCPNAVWMGVGGSFDVWAGTKARAPAWFRKHHLEWLYRLSQEPRRWRRMLTLPQFAWQTLRGR
jgi:N-acetylglucosaminyldiphosphoundecaprenol N-acetyl-beta-D-mannosaminyltransferase